MSLVKPDKGDGFGWKEGYITTVYGFYKLVNKHATNFTIFFLQYQAKRHVHGSKNCHAYHMPNDNINLMSPYGSCFNLRFTLVSPLDL